MWSDGLSSVHLADSNFEVEISADKTIPLKSSECAISSTDVLCPHPPFNDHWVLVKWSGTTTLLPVHTSCQPTFSFLRSIMESKCAWYSLNALSHFLKPCLTYQWRIIPRVGAVVQSIIVSHLQCLHPLLLSSKLQIKFISYLLKPFQWLLSLTRQNPEFSIRL